MLEDSEPVNFYWFNRPCDSVMTVECAYRIHLEIVLKLDFEAVGSF